MQNYYEILGLSDTASITEVKAAFRLLAKKYHPDINPGGRDHFVLVLKAYETLSDPQQKYIYDSRLRTSSSQSISNSSSKTTKEKSWKFDERELRRRQYYDEHIRKYEKKNTSEVKVEHPKSNYNEFKYVLFATPLAVLLFIGIMYMAADKPATITPFDAGQSEQITPLHPGDSPYSFYFGKSAVAATDSASLVVKNMSGYDAVICLFRKDKFLRCFFVNHGVSATIPQLPCQNLKIRYCTGSSFNLDKLVEGCQVVGAFEKNTHYYITSIDFNLKSNNELTLLPGTNQGFTHVLPIEFFKKEL